MSTTASSQPSDGPARYIARLKKHVDKTAHLNWLQPRLNSQSKITHNYSIIHGFAGNFTEEALSILNSSSDVEQVENDIVLEDYDGEVIQSPSPWGLNRISQKDKLPIQDELSDRFLYRYLDPQTQSSPINVYVIDSGVMIDHEDFEGRASWGYVGEGAKAEDTDGHGTAVASVAAGQFCGVSKHAYIIACKRSSPHGSEAIACLDYVLQQWLDNGIPSVVNMSFGHHDPDQQSTSLDDATEAIIQAGVHVCIAAGNRNGDASETTPARAKGANTTGSSTIADKRSSTSNYGSVLKLFAPGRKINVADIATTSSYSMKSGTSFASPHVRNHQFDFKLGEIDIL